MVERIDAGRPISHVADEAHVSRQRLGEWYRRWKLYGEAGLEDRSSRPLASPNQISEELGDQIEEMSGDLLMVQNLLGHASPATTAGYAAWANHHAAAVVATLFT